MEGIDCSKSVGRVPEKSGTRTLVPQKKRSKANGKIVFIDRMKAFFKFFSLSVAIIFLSCKPKRDGHLSSSEDEDIGMKSNSVDQSGSSKKNDINNDMLDRDPFSDSRLANWSNLAPNEIHDESDPFAESELSAGNAKLMSKGKWKINLPGSNLEFARTNKTILFRGDLEGADFFDGEIQLEAESSFKAGGYHFVVHFVYDDPNKCKIIGKEVASGQLKSWSFSRIED